MKSLYLVLTLLLLTGCMSTTAPTANPISTPHLLPPVPAGGMVFVPLQSSGTPEATPILIVEATIIDATTQKAVPAKVYVVNSEAEREPTDDELVSEKTKHFELKLLSQLNGWLVVRAPGYEDWKLRMYYHLKTSRRLSGPIELKPLPGKMTL